MHWEENIEKSLQIDNDPYFPMTKLVTSTIDHAENKTEGSIGCGNSILCMSRCETACESIVQSLKVRDNL